MRVVLMGLLLIAATRSARDRLTAIFKITRATAFDQPVFVLGDIPELGADDLTRAVNIEPSASPRRLIVGVSGIER